MKTYPVYIITHSGSNDCWGITQIAAAAKSPKDALRYKASGGSGAGENGTPKWTCSFGAGPIRSIIKHPTLRSLKLGRVELFPKDL
jgi:hypothetical protein